MIPVATVRTPHEHHHPAANWKLGHLLFAASSSKVSASPSRASQRSTIHVGWLEAIPKTSAWLLPEVPSTLGEGISSACRMRVSVLSTPAFLTQAVSLTGGPDNDIVKTAGNGNMALVQLSR